MQNQEPFSLGPSRPSVRHVCHQELEEHGPSPDAAVYNVLLMAEESAEGVREVVRRMRRQGVAPNERTYRWVAPNHPAFHVPHQVGRKAQAASLSRRSFNTQ